jgi:YgiT-type zinc finger domain-containing protein
MGIRLADSEGKVNMECLHCKGTLARKRVSYTATRKGYHLIIDDVPAWACEQCGEPLFDEETVDAIQEMLREVDIRREKLALLSAVV